jgi:hypothetical protein
MKKAKFVQDAKLDPARYYRNPSDVIRDRRLTNKDRLEILAAWERDARIRLQPNSLADSEPPSEDDELARLRRVRAELEARPESQPSGAPGRPNTQDA